MKIWEQIRSWKDVKNIYLWNLLYGMNQTGLEEWVRVTTTKNQDMLKNRKKHWKC